MNLRTKIFGLLVLAFALFGAVAGRLISVQLDLGYRHLDEISLQRDNDLAREAFSSEIRAIDESVNAWAHWDAMQNYAAVNDLSFAESELSLEAQIAGKLSTLVVLNAQKNVLHALSVDLESGESEPMPELVRGALERILPHLSLNSSRQFYGLVSDGTETFAAAIQAIDSSSQDRQYTGYLVFARRLDVPAMLRRFSLDPVRATLSPRSSGKSHSTQSGTDEAGSLQTETQLPSLVPGEQVRLTMVSDGKMYVAGQEVRAVILFWYVMLTLVLSFLTAVIFDKLFLKRLDALTTDLDGIRGTSVATAHVRSLGTDELGRVGAKVEEMLNSLRVTYAELEEAQLRFREIADHTPVLIWMMGLDREMIYINQTFSKFTGSPLEPGVRLEMEAVVYEEDRLLVHERFEQLFSEGIAVQFESRLNGAGRTSWFLVTIVPVRDGEENIRYFIASGTNIDEQKRAEQEHSKARELALNLSAVKSNFVATVSHELRTPMNGILGFTGLLLSSPLSDEQRRDLELVHSSANSLLVLIDDLLDFSKLEAGKFQIASEPFNLVSIFQTTESIVGVRAAEKSQELLLVVDPDVPRHVRGDSLRVRQILVNILGNAIKFTREGGAIVMMASVVGNEGDSTLVQLAVADTGVGIEESQLLKLFQPFSQADSSISRRFGGTGLGLSISKRLVELMGGTIEVRSKPSVGSLFLVTLPLTVMEGDFRPPIVEYSAGYLSADPKLSVLVVEDNLINQRVVTKLLEKQGHSVIVASNGQECLDLLKESAFDIILMDCQMPILDGFAATREIRRMETEESGEAARLPIIALTANAMDGDRERCIESGMDDFVSKPIHPETLYTALRKVVVGRA